MALLGRISRAAWALFSIFLLCESYLHKYVSVRVIQTYIGDGLELEE